MNATDRIAAALKMLAAQPTACNQLQQALEEVARVMEGLAGIVSAGDRAAVLVRFCYEDWPTLRRAVYERTSSAEIKKLPDKPDVMTIARHLDLFLRVFDELRQEQAERTGRAKREAEERARRRAERGTPLHLEMLPDGKVVGIVDTGSRL